MSEFVVDRKGLYFGTRKENFFDYLKCNNGLCIIYGATVWGEMLLHEGSIKVNYFCDRKAGTIHDINGIPVIDSIQLETLIKESGKRATIIICVGINKGTVNSIYGDLVQLDIEADVFNYFENLHIFSDNTFRYNGQNLLLYEHTYNCGYVDERMTERCVELALAKEWLEKCNGNVVEIGAVTPYYFYCNKIIDVVDPTDKHRRVNHRKSLFDMNFSGKGYNILSISTVEHIGRGDYGLTEKTNVIDAVNKILHEADSCFITAPLGYNEVLDNWVRSNRDNSMIKIMERGINNHWTEISTYDFEKIEYGPLWANGLLIIEK